MKPAAARRQSAALATTLAGATALALALAATPAAAHPHHGHHPAIPFTAATVTAAADGSYTLKWDTEGVRRVEVRAHGKVVARGGARGEATVTGLPAADRQWFTFQADHGQGLRLADRLVKLDSTVNFRDAGGYRTADGHWVKMGEVYRSDALNHLTPNDAAKLQRLGIKGIFDLRMQSERDKDPDVVPAGVKYTVADVFGESGFNAMPRTPDEAVASMVGAEKTMVSADSGKAAYRTVFAGIEGSDAPGTAVLFHCTAGKDRTGWAAAALLTALGVPRETVTADYLASNDYRKAANDAILSHLPPAQAAVYKPLLDVRPEYLNSGYDEVTAKFGTFRNYTHQGLALDHHALADLKRDLLLG
ncbi:tyrosine-protein phosphatase [Streptomyces sp. NPDC089919]|uniref:tyrosine-protein phosphatase n=1 Tax=Streptomyces sp. NPDC089919 TaxID=3155188 RepID=UPI00343307C3